jgi:hypothetical protein
MMGLSLSNMGLGLGSSGAGASVVYASRIINSDGARTWYNHPVVLADGAVAYSGSVSTLGSVQVTKTENKVDSVFTMNPALQVDDHNEATMLELPGGKLACFYSRHSSDTVGLRYRVTSNDLPDMSAFSAEVLISNGGVDATAYTLPFMLEDNEVRVYFRSGGGAGTRPRKMARAPGADVEAGTATWAVSTIFETTDERPYMVACQNGTDRIDFLVTDGHPNESPTSLYHCYMQLDAGTEKYYQSDGTEITAPIDVTTEATLVDNTTGGRTWNDKIAIGSDGHPRILFTKYPSGTDGANGGATFTDIEYWHGRWTGSAWVKTRLLTGQYSLYSGEVYYAGGMCFDGNDVTTLYLCEIVSGKYEVRKYSFNEAAATKTLVTDITTGSSTNNIRPQSPVGATRPFAVSWLDGTYTTYQNFATVMHAYAPEAGTFTPADLYAASEKGAWYDPSDFSTMWQDTAGTTPVTATGQSVARIDDKSGNAKHLLQGTAGSMPVLQQDAGGNYYLDFDGTDDFMSCASFDLTTTDCVTVTAGLRKDSDAATGLVVELSTSSSANSGTFALFAPGANGATTFVFRHRGSVDSTTTATGQTAPLTAVVTGLGEIGGDYNRIRVNGAVSATLTSNQGTGAMISATLYVGRRAGTSVPFNGRLYGMIIRGVRSGPIALEATETWMNGKTEAY